MSHLETASPVQLTFPTGTWEFLVPDTYDDRKNFDISVSVTEADLNKHVIDTHIYRPAILERVGVRFDAELAQARALDLTRSAGVMVDFIEACENGTLRESDVYAAMGEENYPTIGGRNRVDHSWMRRVIFGKKHQHRLASALVTLSAHEVIDESVISEQVRVAMSLATIVPHVSESFYELFNAQKISDTAQ